MPTGGPTDPDGHDVPRVQGSGSPETDRALGSLLDAWQREDPEGYAAFMRGDSNRVRLSDRGAAPDRPYRQGSSLRVTRPRTRVAMMLAALVLLTSISPLPRMALGVVDTLTYTPTEPVTSVPRPVSGGRLAPIVPVGGAPPADEYAFMATQPGSGEPVRFDPCRPIHYVIREHGMGPEAIAVVHDAAARVSAATGLVLVYDGLTDEAPDPNRPADAYGRYGGGYAPVLVAWSDPTEVPRLEDTIAGVGGPTSERGPDGWRTYVTGEVSLDGPQLAPELTPLKRWSVTAVVMHELGHVVGADHPADASQLMAAQHRNQRDWQDGDRYALALLGQGRCG